MRLSSSVDFLPATRDGLSRFLAKQEDDGVLARLAHQWLGPQGGNPLFFVPTRDRPLEPASLGYAYENVEFFSTGGVRLHGWYFPAHGPRPARATIVFSHGNTGSLGHHFGLVAWLIHEGFNLFMYDYRGYGASEGSPDRQGVVDDVAAAFRYVASRQDLDAGRLVSLGHSLGAAATITGLGLTKPEGLVAVVGLAPFVSYRAMALRLGGKIGAGLVTDELSPRDYIGLLAPTPLLLIHATGDALIPIAHSEILHDLAGEPKTLLEVSGCHVHLVSPHQLDTRGKILAWLQGCL
jgi:fermentation-respiration switch protein FrsA (DUF1100 family)